jgi:PTH1 family peptidyl-tRNA hydrolase
VPYQRNVSTKCVVGLGNPGREYAATRHNVGFRVVETLARKWNAGRGRRVFNGRLFKTLVGPSPIPVLLFQPHTFMNRSGSAVRDVAGFHKIDGADLLIVLDDMAMPLGQLRLRSGGSAGGHNGLADVLEAFGTQDVPRLRVGIGAAPPRMDPADYVLRPFQAGEKERIERAIEHAAQAVEDWVIEGIEYAMGKHNDKATGQERPADACPGTTAPEGQGSDGR